MAQPFKWLNLGYCDKSDPRIFVFKNQKYKWQGVTLNYAHRKAWTILFLTLLPFLLAFTLNILTTQAVWHLAIWAFVFIYALGIAAFYWHMASKGVDD